MIIAVDFDGTIVEHKFPKLGNPLPDAFKVLKKIKSEGHVLILWTYRTGAELKQAVTFCKRNGLEFNSINCNAGDEDLDFTHNRKIYADLFIDDRNILGIPDWNTIYGIIQSLVEKAQE